MKSRLREREFLDVYDLTMPELYALVFRWTRGQRTLSEDIVQETYLRALCAWDRKGLPNDPGAWLRTVAKNLLISHARKVRPITLEEAILPLDGAVLSPEDQAETHLVRRALVRLRHSYRRVIESFYLDGKTMKEIAEDESTTSRAVEGRLRRARQKIREFLGIVSPPRREDHGQQ